MTAHADRHDARLYPRQVGLLFLDFPELARPLARELAPAELNIAAAEVQIARIVRDHTYVDLSMIRDELTCSQDTPGAQTAPQG